MSTTKVWDFTIMNPPKFFGFKSDEDPQEFFNDIQKFTDIMCLTPIKTTDLDVYKLKRVSHNWFKWYKEDRGVDVGLV